MSQKGVQKILSLIISILIVGCILLILTFSYLSFTMPPEDEYDVMGVPVMYGNVADAFGDTEPLGTDVDVSLDNIDGREDINDESYYTEEYISEDDLSTTQEETQEVIVQEEEVVIPVQNTKTKEQIEKEKLRQEQKLKADKQAKEEADKIAKEKAIEAKKAEEARKAAENKARIEQQMKNSFGSPDGQAGGSRGETQGTGMQGVATGNASHGATSGVGYNGSYSLNGRTLGKGGLVKPKYTVDDYGTVIIDVVVDPSGKVVEALIGKGSSVLNANLINEALNAAKATKFNEINSLVNQKGTITFVFGYQ